MLTEIYLYFPLSLQVSSGLVHQLRQDRTLVRALINNHPTFDPAQSDTPIMGRDSVVGIETWLRDRGSGVQILTGVIYFLLKTSTGSLGLRLSLFNGYRVFPRRKAAME
jgi:hypothetical protein